MPPPNRPKGDKTMSIQYALFENNLTSGPDNYAAHVQLTGSADLDTIVHHTADQGSKWSAQDIRAMLGEVTNTCKKLLLDGYRINLGDLCEIYPQVTGVFDSAIDHFDHSRHRIDVGASPSTHLRKFIHDNAHVSKVEAIKPAPAPMEYTDAGSGEANGTLTPGNIGTLDGHRLKIDPAHADEGIFFIPTSGAEKKAATISKNKPGQLIFLVPDLKPGDYHIEVRAHLFNGSELRAGRLGAMLTVSGKNEGGREKDEK